MRKIIGIFGRWRGEGKGRRGSKEKRGNGRQETGRRTEDWEFKG